MAKQVIPTEFDPEGFAEFWATYPRKEAKVDAYKAWRQIQPARDTQGKIREALAWQVDSHEWANKPKFCPLPATYLRGQRWTDEPPKTPQRTFSNVTAAAIRAIQEAGE